MDSQARASRTEAATQAVAELVRQGLGNWEISERLGMPYNSVKAHVWRAGLRANTKPRKGKPWCGKCKVRRECMRSVVELGPFARAECE